MRSTRFTADPLDVALLQFSSNSENFKAEEVAIILNESFSGTAIVLQTKRKIAPEQVLTAKVGNLAPMSAKVIWVKEIEKDLLKMGLNFLE